MYNINVDFDLLCRTEPRRCSRSFPGGWNEISLLQIINRYIYTIGRFTENIMMIAYIKYIGSHSEKN